MADERNAEKLKRLLRELGSTGPKRPYSRYRVKNREGSIYRRPKRAELQRKSR